MIFDDKIHYSLYYGNVKIRKVILTIKLNKC